MNISLRQFRTLTLLFARRSPPLRAYMATSASAPSPAAPLPAVNHEAKKKRPLNEGPRKPKLRKAKRPAVEGSNEEVLALEIAELLKSVRPGDAHHSAETGAGAALPEPFTEIDVVCRTLS